MKISLVVLAFVFLFFQNCSDTRINSNKQSSKKESPLSLNGNGEGYDGKIRRYVEPDDKDECNNGSKIANEINVDLATKTAFKVVEDCKKVSWKSIKSGIPNFDPETDSSFFFEGVTFKSAGIYGYSSSGNSSGSGNGDQFMDLINSDPNFNPIDPLSLPPPILPEGPLFPFGPPPEFPPPPPGFPEPPF